MLDRLTFCQSGALTGHHLSEYFKVIVIHVHIKVAVSKNCSTYFSIIHLFCLNCFVFTWRIFNRYCLFPRPHRYYAICCQPLVYRNKMTPLRVALMIGGCWIIPTVISFLPIMQGWNSIGINDLVSHIHQMVVFADKVCEGSLILMLVMMILSFSLTLQSSVDY